MRSFPVENKATGYITVEPVLAELADVVDTLHGLDADNLGTEAVTPAKFTVGTFATVLRGARDSLRTTTLDAKHRPGDVYAIPEDASDDPWRVDFTCKEGRLWGRFSITVDSDYTSGDGAAGYSFWVGVRVDGELEAIGPAGTAVMMRTSSHACAFSIPISGGNHTIEFVYGYGGTLAPGRDVDLEWAEGNYFFRVEER